MSCSRTAATSAAVTGRERSARNALFSKQAPYASAFTSHGWPRVCVHTASSASGANACPVSAVCWPSRASVSAREKSPSRSDSAAMLNGLPEAPMR